MVPIAAKEHKFGKLLFDPQVRWICLQLALGQISQGIDLLSLRDRRLLGAIPHSRLLGTDNERKRGPLGPF